MEEVSVADSGRLSPGGTEEEPCDPPPMLEVLGEHLYAKVTELKDTLCPDSCLDVARLTGILLELGEKQVLKFLQEEDLLHQAVKRVLLHVPGVASPVSPVCLRKEEESWAEKDVDLKEHLYDQVCQQEPELAAQITGMLLELPVPQVKSLLRSKAKLSQAVAHARAACFSQHASLPQPDSYSREAPCPDSSNSSERPWRRLAKEDHPLQEEDSSGEEEGEEGDAEDEMGESVFAEAERLYPDCAEKLTGMVLDMGPSRVQALLRDAAQLHQVLREAFSSLSSSSSSRRQGPS